MQSEYKWGFNKGKEHGYNFRKNEVRDIIKQSKALIQKAEQQSQSPEELANGELKATIKNLLNLINFINDK